MSQDVQSTLNVRGNSHGDFRENGRIMQALKDVVRNAGHWPKLQSHQREAIDMICHKIGRVLCGNPNHADHWHDIAGYATLCENIIVHGEPYLKNATAAIPKTSLNTPYRKEGTLDVRNDPFNAQD